MQYLVDAIDDQKIDCTPEQVPVTRVEAIPNADALTLKCQDRKNAQLRLVVVKRLWQTMRTIFPQAPLVPAAEALFSCLVNNEASLLLENVRMEGVIESDSGESTRDKWVSLCVSVLSVCDVSAVRRFWGYDEGGAMSGLRDKALKWTQDFTNAVWRSTVEQWRDGECHWEGAVVLLGVPFT